MTKLKLNVDFPETIIDMMRLKEDVTLFAEYYEGTSTVPKFFPKGTLIECSDDGYVYLDEDGDGELYFPKEVLEPVKCNMNSLDSDNVLWQG